MADLRKTIAAEFSTSKVRCCSCRNLIGLEQAHVLDGGWVCCRRCRTRERVVLERSLTPAFVEDAGSF